MGPQPETSIPIFSLLELKQGHRRDDLLNCLEKDGSFYLKDYGLQETDHEQLRKTTLDFFEHGSQEEIESVVRNIPGVRRGFSKLGTESTAQVTDNGNFTDYATCYSMGVSENVFPSKAFEQVWTPYFNQMYKAARDVAKVVLEATESDCGDDIDQFLDSEPVLRYRYYPDVPEQRCAEHQPLRMAPHYDLSILTLVHQTPCPNGFVSLQLQRGDIYVDMPSIPNTVVVLCGSVGTLVSNGKIKPAMHQVRSPGFEKRVGSSRTSSTLFLRPKSKFNFSVQKARDVGFKVCVKGEIATFRDWMGGNYIGMEATD